MDLRKAISTNRENRKETKTKNNDPLSNDKKLKTIPSKEEEEDHRSLRRIKEKERLESNQNEKKLDVKKYKNIERMVTCQTTITTKSNGVVITGKNGNNRSVLFWRLSVDEKTGSDVKQHIQNKKEKPCPFGRTTCIFIGTCILK